jgi:DNA-binding MarR family transcriptional regulator
VVAEARWLDEEEAKAWRALQMMQLRLNGRLAHDLSVHSDLGYQDYTVLVVLTDQADGSVRLFELARQLCWEKSRLSHHISRMVGRGLVRKFSCPSDRRGAFIEVTAKGREKLADAAPSHVEAVRRLFLDRLGPPQLAQLSDICGRVLVALDQEPEIDGAGEDACPGWP